MLFSFFWSEVKGSSSKVLKLSGNLMQTQTSVAVSRKAFAKDREHPFSFPRLERGIWTLPLSNNLGPVDLLPKDTISVTTIQLGMW